MGKPYGIELQKLDSTYSWAIETSIDQLISFVHSSNGLPMLAIGSGGSLTAANFASILHQHTGTISKCLTPLEFVSMKIPMHNMSILFLTAGGHNFDILKSFKVAVSAEPRHIMALCTTKGSSLSDLVSDVHYAHFSDFDLPSGKDGFLATNSLLSMMVFLARGYMNYFPTSYEFPASLKDLVHPDISRQEFENQLKKNIEPMINRDALVILHSKWGKTAAIDAESKFTEAGLGNVLLADYRNFGHGRHNWLVKQKDRTGVIGLITPDDIDIADRTLNLIPKDIPTIRFSTEKSGPVATLALLVKIMYLVKFIGESKGIDPGRPKVPDFGKRIYHVRMVTPERSHPLLEIASQEERIAISRKITNELRFATDNTELELWRGAYQKFVYRLENQRFGAVVFDYDGTLCDSGDRFVGASQTIGRECGQLLEKGITIGVATGRGKSVRDDLQKIIPKEYWSQILVGYYNGSDIGVLNDNSHPNKNIDMDPTLESISFALKNHQLLSRIANCECRPKQITFEPSGISSLQEIMYILESIIPRTGINGIQILESSHSIDVLAPGVSKLNLVRDTEMIAKQLNKPTQTLCIGDKGKWPGNDFFLLSEKYSLSVDTVSPDFDSCWNLAPIGHRGVQAVLDYFNAIEIEDGAFLFKSKRLGVKRNERCPC